MVYTPELLGSKYHVVERSEDAILRCGSGAGVRDNAEAVRLPRGSEIEQRALQADHSDLPAARLSQDLAEPVEHSERLAIIRPDPETLQSTMLSSFEAAPVESAVNGFTAWRSGGFHQQQLRISARVARRVSVPACRQYAHVPASLKDAFSEMLSTQIGPSGNAQVRGTGFECAWQAPQGLATLELKSSLALCDA
eukprot:3740678-Pyramimonas_sp.AAC.1